MRQVKLIIAALFLISPFAANADLIEGLCDGTADATVTCDTDTTLEWLDLTETELLSVDDFLADVGGWLTDGWSWATTALVDQLFLNAGAVDIAGNANPGNDPALALLESLLGSMNGCSTAGSGACGSADLGGGLAAVLAYDLSLARFFGGIGLGTVATDYTQGGIGVFAYRESSVASVPEPGTLALFGIGLLGMGLARRNRKA